LLLVEYGRVHTRKVSGVGKESVIKRKRQNY
jgi:hypothetical protein